MLKTFALTISLAVSAYFVGYYADTAISTVLDMRCAAQAAWTAGQARQAQEAVRDLTTRELANYPR